jgi:hypothetical protein
MKPEQPKTDKPRFVIFPELKTYYGEPRSRWSLQRLIKAGKFPAATTLSGHPGRGGGRIAWETAALDHYYDNLAKAE